ncbi:flagellar hook-length control protein FliK [Paenibacillus prosopidis]|uniref:Flagellar hook-length control protein FliK n=1 Tax=Paenibacillus prosopidis TaxID=630520 RepID=A0A368W3X7_9BACL|nr:flagellar hook-length control protein FliK [Paenibacillus prosopidis]RCW50121.1 flagellar hook-length control protein FliK [Paenibacillus prosopidis]
MEMMIPQIASAQPQVQSTNNAQVGKSANGAAFQQTLIHHINGEAAVSENVQLVQVIAKAGNTNAAANEGVTVAPTISELLTIIDGLIEQLETPDAEEEEQLVEEEQQLKQLEAALDQMTALLALLGAPVTIVQQSASLANIADDNSSSDSAVMSTANVKSDIQDVLLQLQAWLQQGSVKRVGQQEPNFLVGQQLQALTAILEGGPVDTYKSQTKSTSLTQQLFTAQSVPQAEVSTLLQRLSQQTVHPAFLSTTINSNELETEVEAEVTGQTIEAIPQMQLGSSHSETIRGAAPLVQNAATATSFVVADEFAQSMTGLIVQKFDVSTLNGVSEAKLMLYPEHLGQVDVRITMQNGILTAIFQTDTALAKDMLDNQMAQLRSALQAQGLMVDKLEVSQGQTAAQLSHQQHGQGSNQQSFTNRQSFKDEDGSVESAFESEMVEQAAVQGLGYGRAINVKA